MTPPDQMHTITDVARRMRVSRWTVRRWIASGAMPAVNINPASGGRRAMRVTESDLQAYIDRLASRRTRPARPATTATATATARRDESPPRRPASRRSPAAAARERQIPNYI